jgi:LysM repeat protein
LGVSIISIVTLNDLKSDCSDIYPGQTLYIPYPTPTIALPGFDSVSSTSQAIVDCDTVPYTIKEGDTLEGISQKYNVQVDPIKVFNGIADEALALAPGNKLAIPLCFRNNQNVGLDPTSTPNPIIDVFPTCHEIALTVLQGDTLDSISVNYAIPKDHIKQYNRLETDDISPGMTLLIQMCSNMPTPTVTPTK